MPKDPILSSILVHEKPALILIALLDSEKSYASTIAKAANCTYSHTVKILDEFESIGIVEFRKDGRIKYITLTKTGKSIAEDMQNLHRKMERIK